MALVQTPAFGWCIWYRGEYKKTATDKTRTCFKLLFHFALLFSSEERILSIHNQRQVTLELKSIATGKSSSFIFFRYISFGRRGDFFAMQLFSPAQISMDLRFFKWMDWKTTHFKTPKYANLTYRKISIFYLIYLPIPFLARCKWCIHSKYIFTSTFQSVLLSCSQFSINEERERKRERMKSVRDREDESDMQVIIIGITNQREIS